MTFLVSVPTGSVEEVLDYLRSITGVEVRLCAGDHLADEEKIVEPKNSTEDKLLKSVNDFELSVRTHDCLKIANIKTIGELIQKTESEMLRTKNFGRKSLNETMDILSSMGLSFKK